MFTLGIDLGTTKIAGVLLSTPDETLRKVISLNSGAALSSREEWERIQDPAIILQKVFAITDELKAAAGGKLAGIGISSQMHGILYIDEKGDPLSPLYTWQDNRAAQPGRGQTPSVIDVIKEKTGKDIYSGYGLATHYYNVTHGLCPDKPYKIVTIGGYVGMKLCGETSPCIDPSESAGIGLYDLKERQFWGDAITTLWGQEDFLPRSVPFYHQAGKEKEGIPVFQSLGDNQASFMGAMGEPDDTLLLNLGTGGQISLLTEQIPEHLDEMEIRPYPHKNLLVGSTLTGGKSFELLVDFFGDVLSFFNRPLAKKEIYARIDEERLTIPSHPLTVKPYFNGTRTDPKRRGTLEDMGLDNLNTYNLLYGFSHAIVRELKDLFDRNRLKEEIPLTGIVGSGNGIRRNSLIRQLVEEQFQCTLRLSNWKEEAACGAAVYAREGLEKSKGSPGHEAPSIKSASGKIPGEGR